MLKSYLSITKPGIIFGNLISVAAGFFLAAKSEPASLMLFLTTLAGVGLVIASGCVVNNILTAISTKRWRGHKIVRP